MALAADFLRWLDVIPGRNWLLVGPGAEALAAQVRAASLPSGVTVVANAVALPFASGAFDVAIAALAPVHDSLMAELRRVLNPAGTLAAYGEAEPVHLEHMFRAAGLHAVLSCTLDGASAARGTR